MELRKQSFKAFYPRLENPHTFVQSKKTQSDLDDMVKNMMIPPDVHFQKTTGVVIAMGGNQPSRLARCHGHCVAI